MWIETEGTLINIDKANEVRIKDYEITLIFNNHMSYYYIPARSKEIADAIYKDFIEALKRGDNYFSFIEKWK